MRFNVADIAAGLVCRFRCGAFVGTLPVIDVSAAGFAAVPPAGVALAPGSALEAFELLIDGHPIWMGEAVVVHGNAKRLGGRFASGALDVQRLKVAATLEGRLATHREQRNRLPPAWRAAVSDLRQLLESVRSEIGERELADPEDPLRPRDEEAKLFAALHERWGKVYYAAIAELYEMSKGFDEATAALARSYGCSTLMPLLAACPLHRRAHEKPLGYAGDFRMMELCFAREPVGETLFGRFLFSVCQNYTLTRAVLAREVVVRSAIRYASRLPGDGPVRIMALAAGPAMELRHWAQELTGLAELQRPVELILVDQDRSALQAAHRPLTRILLERLHGRLPVTVQCLHLSVRQIVSPHTPDEHGVLRGLADLDLVYSTGLYDYLPSPVATRLTRRLYSLLGPAGRMLVGNLSETPDTTWLMEYVLGWPIIYRTSEGMRQLGRGIVPDDALNIRWDTTGRCLFLELVKSSPTHRPMSQEQTGR